MNAGKNQRALLMELLVVVLFFSLCATTLLQTFMAARETSRRAGIQSEALTEMQVISEKLYAAKDVETCLQAEGFTPWTPDAEPGKLMSDDASGWVRTSGTYSLAVYPAWQTTEAGVLLDVTLMAVLEDELLTQWHCVRYLPGEVSE